MKMERRCPRALFAYVFLVAGCSDELATIDLTSRIDVSSSPAEKQHVYRFGFDLRANEIEDARQYLPFLAYLESATGYHFSLHFTPANRRLSEEIAEDRIDFAAAGAMSFLEAEELGGAIPLARGRNQQGHDRYRSVFVALPESPIRSLEDLRGRRLAFGSPSSTQGHVIPRLALESRRIQLRDLDDYQYTGSHQACANAVIARRADACAMQDTMAFELERAGSARVIDVSPEYPSSGIIASKDVAADVLKRVRSALLRFEPEGRHGAALYNWDRTEMPKGFVAASASDYDELRDGASKLGLIGGPVQ